MTDHEPGCDRAPTRRQGARWAAQGPIGPEKLRRVSVPLRAAAELGGVALRGTLVTSLLDLEVPPHTARDIVGHAATEVTMTIQTQSSMEEKRRALQRRDGRLTGGTD